MARWAVADRANKPAKQPRTMTSKEMRPERPSFITHPCVGIEIKSRRTAEFITRSVVRQSDEEMSSTSVENYHWRKLTSTGRGARTSKARHTGVTVGRENISP